VNATSPLLELEKVLVAPPDVDDPVEDREMEIEQWTVEPGQFWVVGGLPTSSPSHLIPTLSGLEKPAAGSLRLLGLEVGALKETELITLRKRVGLVFSQGGRLLRQLSVAENIALPLRYHLFMLPEEVEERVHLLAKALDLEWHLNRSATLLSPSARQRVALARALALEPEILFLDRPFAVANADRHGWWLETLGALHRGWNGRPPMTIVVGTDFLRPWLTTGHHFAVARQRRWHRLGGAAEAEAYSALAPDGWTRQKQGS
jgi:phospholipid/cholesterol/gamma-HCH transport system ATP-binding protein